MVWRKCNVVGGPFSTDIGNAIWALLASASSRATAKNKTCILIVSLVAIFFHFDFYFCARARAIHVTLWHINFSVWKCCETKKPQKIKTKEEAATIEELIYSSIANKQRNKQTLFNNGCAKVLPMG